MKTNCWEVKKCGRQQNGIKTGEFGICLARSETSYNGKNGGKNGGRYCWKIAGTLCGGEVQGSFARKVGNCMACDFFKQVRKEEGKEFQL